LGLGNNIAGSSGSGNLEDDVVNVVLDWGSSGNPDGRTSGLLHDGVVSTSWVGEALELSIEGGVSVSAGGVDGEGELTMGVKAGESWEGLGRHGSEEGSGGEFHFCD